MNAKEIVETGYDRIAEQYLATKDPRDPTILAALTRLAQSLPAAATVLDLGCGAGVPVTQWLAERFSITGVDLSARQLELARQHAAGATLIQADMAAVEFAPAAFDAVVAFYSIIHVPREEQPELVRRIHRWLKPGGRFLANWALGAWEGEEQNWEGWGATMWWSLHDAETNRAMLHEAGFGIAEADVRTSGGETWLWIEACREARLATANRAAWGIAG